MTQEKGEEQKLQSLMRKAQKQQEEQLQTEAKINQLMKNVLTDQARERLTNIRLVKPELFQSVFSTIIYLAQQGRVTGKLGDDEIKALLEKLSEKREIKIRRK